jgi:drug/metabolite transporter (DMT)-like permease
VYARRASLPPHPLVATALEMIAGGSLLIIAAAVTGEFGRVHLTEIPASSIAGFLWLVVAGSMLAFTAYGYANTHLPADTVATYAYINPVVAVALGALLGQEPVSPNVILGGSVIVGAVVLIVAGRAVTRRFRRRTLPGPVAVTRPEPAPPTKGSTP